MLNFEGKSIDELNIGSEKRIRHSRIFLGEVVRKWINKFDSISCF